MDQEVLVKAGKAITAGLDAAKTDYKLAMWIYKPEVDSWKFWILPTKKIEQRDFYREIADIVSKRRSEMGDIDISDVEMIGDSHPAVRALKGAFRVEGGAVMNASKNVINGFYLPQAIILKSTL